MRARIAVIALLLGGCSTDVRAARPRFEGTNVALIVVDTLRADALDSAPFLRQIASESVVFENTRSTSCWTPPAVASIFTSLYPDHHGVNAGIGILERLEAVEQVEEFNRLPDDRITLPELFQAAGYRTFGISDNPLVGKELGFSRGFDRFEKHRYATAAMVNQTLRSWSDDVRASERPWFLYVHYMDPHWPYHERGLPDQDPPPSLLAGPLAEERAAYAGEVAYVAEHIAEVFELFDLREEALVVLVSDHGEELGEHGNRGHGRTLYDEVVRVPFLVRPPGNGSGLRVRTPASLIDVLPTLDELVGLGDLHPAEGVSLADPILGLGTGELLRDRPLYSQRFHEVWDELARMESVVVDERKAIFGNLPVRRELYDLREDSEEESDLSDERPLLYSEMEQLVRAFRQRPRTVTWNPTGIEEISAEDLDALVRLGYVGED